MKERNNKEEDDMWSKDIENDYIREMITYPGKREKEKKSIMWKVTPVTCIVKKNSNEQSAIANVMSKQRTWLISADFQRMALIVFGFDTPEPFIDDLIQHLDVEIV